MNSSLHSEIARHRAADFRARPRGRGTRRDRAANCRPSQSSPELSRPCGTWARERIGDRSPRRNTSGRPDSNRRPPAPKAGALPGCATSRHSQCRPWPGLPTSRRRGAGARRSSRRAPAPVHPARPPRRQPRRASRQLDRVERLRDVVDAPQVDAPRPVAEVGPGGQKDDRDAAGFLVLEQALRDRPAVEPGHHDVQEDDVGTLPLAPPRARSGRPAPRRPPCPRPRG